MTNLNPKKESCHWNQRTVPVGTLLCVFVMKEHTILWTLWDEPSQPHNAKTQKDEDEGMVSLEMGGTSV